MVARKDNHFFIKLYNKSYFEAARGPRVRSIQKVCEQPEGEADAERALLDNFTTTSYI